MRFSKSPMSDVIWTAQKNNLNCGCLNVFFCRLISTISLDWWSNYLIISQRKREREREVVLYNSWNRLIFLSKKFIEENIWYTYIFVIIVIVERLMLFCDCVNMNWSFIKRKPSHTQKKKLAVRGKTLEPKLTRRTRTFQQWFQSSAESPPIG